MYATNAVDTRTDEIPYQGQSVFQMSFIKKRWKSLLFKMPWMTVNLADLLTNLHNTNNTHKDKMEKSNLSAHSHGCSQG